MDVHVIAQVWSRDNFVQLLLSFIFTWSVGIKLGSEGLHGMYGILLALKSFFFLWDLEDVIDLEQET